MKNLASAANGSGVSPPSGSRLNEGHWRQKNYTDIKHNNTCAVPQSLGILQALVNTKLSPETDCETTAT